MAGSIEFMLKKDKSNKLIVKSRSLSSINLNDFKKLKKYFKGY